MLHLNDCEKSGMEALFYKMILLFGAVAVLTYFYRFGYA